MIPLPQLGLELLVGVGAALFAGNTWALLRPTVARWRGRPPTPKVPSPARAVVSMLIGAIGALWAVATLIVRG